MASSGGSTLRLLEQFFIKGALKVVRICSFLAGNKFDNIDEESRFQILIELGSGQGSSFIFSFAKVAIVFEI